MKVSNREKSIFISFVEEAVLNSDYYGYIGGRIEVSHPKDHFPSEEIRFFTKNVDEFCVFREEWDWKGITKEQLGFVRDMVALKFND